MKSLGLIAPSNRTVADPYRNRVRNILSSTILTPEHDTLTSRLFTIYYEMTHGKRSTFPFPTRPITIVSTASSHSSYLPQLPNSKRKQLSKLHHRNDPLRPRLIRARPPLACIQVLSRSLAILHSLLPFNPSIQVTR
jgi:hypothetical protein